MINVLNINTKIIEDKLSNFYFRNEYQLVALRINRYTSSSQFQKGW